MQLKLIDPQSSEADLAKEALFTKHPEMEGKSKYFFVSFTNVRLTGDYFMTTFMYGCLIGWPKNHHFQIFKLEIKNIFLIDWFGGPKPISPTEYLEYEK